MTAIDRGLLEFDALRPCKISGYNVDRWHRYLEKMVSYLSDNDKNHHYISNSVYYVLHIASGGADPHYRQLRKDIYMYGMQYLKKYEYDKEQEKHIVFEDEETFVV